MTAIADQPVIILGMHRSGSSLLAGSLQAAGLDLGEVNNAAPHNIKGNKENLPIRELNDQILHAAGSDWKNPPHHLPLSWNDRQTSKAADCTQSLRASGHLWGFKDPRTIWTLEGWLELFPNAHMIAVFRHPNAVIRSLCARGGDLEMSTQDALTLWRKTNARLLQLWSERRFPLLHFSEANFENAFMAPLRAFCQSHELKSDPSSFFSTELVHNDGAGVIHDREAKALFASLIQAANGML